MCLLINLIATTICALFIVHINVCNAEEKTDASSSNEIINLAESKTRWRPVSTAFDSPEMWSYKPFGLKASSFRFRVRLLFAP
jgi:hypothetical protein